jgi:hypothetical protein
LSKSLHIEKLKWLWDNIFINQGGIIKMNNNDHAALRQKQIEDFRASGQTAVEWSKENNIRVSTLRYWIAKTKKKDNKAPQGFVAFAPTTTKTSILVVKIGSYEIELAPGFDALTFREVALLLKSL